jgi:hypothetical protein
VQQGKAASLRVRRTVGVEQASDRIWKHLDGDGRTARGESASEARASRRAESPFHGREVQRSSLRSDTSELRRRRNLPLCSSAVRMTFATGCSASIVRPSSAGATTAHSDSRKPTPREIAIRRLGDPFDMQESTSLLGSVGSKKRPVPREDIRSTPRSRRGHKRRLDDHVACGLEASMKLSCNLVGDPLNHGASQTRLTAADRRDVHHARHAVWIPTRPFGKR